MNLRPYLVGLTAAALLSSCPAFAVESGSMRCERGIVSPGNVMAEVVAKCGDPTFTTRHQESRGDRERFWTVTVEEWTYNFGPNQFMYNLVFENGRVVRIDSLDWGY